jgi:hypothetical protein
MTYEMPYADIVADAMDGKVVVVFCDTMTQMNGCMAKVAELARRKAENVKCGRRNQLVTIDGNPVKFAIGVNSVRGLRADSVYMSVKARTQHDVAALMGATVK